jgi:hypothetical protein
MTGWPNPRVYWSKSVAFRCAWEHLGAPVTSLGVPTTSLGALATSLGTPEITVEQSGKHNIFFGNTAGAPEKHSYYLLFNNF